MGFAPLVLRDASCIMSFNRVLQLCCILSDVLLHFSLNLITCAHLV